MSEKLDRTFNLQETMRHVQDEGLYPIEEVFRCEQNTYDSEQRRKSGYPPFLIAIVNSTRAKHKPEITKLLTQFNEGDPRVEEFPKPDGLILPGGITFNDKPNMYHGEVQVEYGGKRFKALAVNVYPLHGEDTLSELRISPFYCVALDGLKK